jgi:hypothetical protein
VISLDRPLSPNSLISALLRAFGSTAASIVFERSLLAPLSTVVLLSIRRFSVAGGGVIARGGVLTGGVFRALLLFEMCALTNAVFEASSAAPILTWVSSELLTLTETIMMRGSVKGALRTIRRLLLRRHEQRCVQSRPHVYFTVRSDAPGSKC